MLKTILMSLGLLTLAAAPLLAADMDATGPAPEIVEATAPAAKPVVKKAKAKGNDEKGVKKVFTEVSEAWAAGDAKALASHWLADGSLINPFGKSAWSRAEVEEVAGADMEMMKGSTQTFSDFNIRFVLGGFALVDCTGTISGAKTPDGSAAPDHAFHIYAAVVQRGAKWYAVSVRPYAFIPAPGSDMASPASVPDSMIEKLEPKKSDKK